MLCLYRRLFISTQELPGTGADNEKSDNRTGDNHGPVRPECVDGMNIWGLTTLSLYHIFMWILPTCQFLPGTFTDVIVGNAEQGQNISTMNSQWNWNSISTGDRRKSETNTGTWPVCSSVPHPSRHKLPEQYKRKAYHPVTISGAPHKYASSTGVYVLTWIIAIYLFHFNLFWERSI